MADLRERARRALTPIESLLVMAIVAALIALPAVPVDPMRRIMTVRAMSPPGL